jgi:hypothetical protein
MYTHEDVFIYLLFIDPKSVIEPCGILEYGNHDSSHMSNAYSNRSHDHSHKDITTFGHGAYD